MKLTQEEIDKVLESMRELGKEELQRIINGDVEGAMLLKPFLEGWREDETSK